MSSNPNWPRWIVASVANYFSAVATTLSLPLLVDGVDERTPDKMHSDHAELRVSGPFVRELNHGYYRLWVDINLLLTDLMGGEGENAYSLMTWQGAFLQAMDAPIPIYRHGTGVDDDGALIGCLSLRRGREESVRVINFGQIGPNDRVRQGMIDGRYETFWSV